MTTKFVPNPEGWAELNRSESMVEAMQAVADDIATEAARLAYTSVHRISGDLGEGYDTDAGIDGEVATGRVNGNDFKAGWAEFGSERFPAEAPLRRGAEAAGFEVRP